MDHIRQQLIKAVEMSISPYSSQADRIQAYHLMEEVKSNKDLMLKYGLGLSELEMVNPVRHFGLQLLEDVIKSHWNEFPLEIKMNLKEAAMVMLVCGTKDLLEEELAIKDRIARLIVEMIKREWPQHWPRLIGDLIALALGGPTRAELVMYVFLRLSEDVATLQTLHGSRKKDILQELNKGMNEIFAFFFNLLETHYVKYRESASNSEEQARHCKVTQVVFIVLGNFIEWVDPQHLMTHKKNFFMAICHLISDASLKVHVAECLLQLVLRKGQTSGRVFMLELFHEDFLKAILSAADTFSKDPTNAQNYLFIKIISQVLSTLGIQLCQLWGKEPGVGEPANFQIYLDALLTLFRHPSLNVYTHTRPTWLQLFKHKEASKNQLVLNCIIPWTQIAFTKIIRHGLPSQQTSDACMYSRLDFDDDEEYLSSFYHIKAEILEVLCVTGVLNATPYLERIRQITTHIVQTPLDPNDKTIAYNQWEALHPALSAVVPRLFCQDNPNKPTVQIVELIATVLQYPADDPIICSDMLSCLSAMSDVLQCSPEWLPKIVEKIFTAANLAIPQGSDKGVTRSYYELRRHCSSLLLKLCRKFPRLFASMFTQLEQAIAELPDDRSDNVSYHRALVCVSAHNHTAPQLDALVASITQPVTQHLQSMRATLNSPAALIAYLGFDQEPGDAAHEEKTLKNRRFLSICVQLLGALCKCDDLDETRSGVFQQVMHSHVTPCLCILFGLARSFNALSSPDCQPMFAPSYRGVVCLSTAYERQLLGLNPKPAGEKIRNPLGKLQDFLITLYEFEVLMFGSAVQSLGNSFYTIPNLPEYLNHSILCNLEHLSDWKLRMVLRNFLKVFCEHCPLEVAPTVLIPILQQLCPTMLHVLSTRWEHLSCLIEKAQQTESEIDLKEMVDDWTIRCLTRQYIEVLRCVLVVKTKTADVDDMDMSAPESANEKTDVTPFNTAVISALGKCVLKDESMCVCIISTLMQCIECADTTCCRKAQTPLVAVLQFLTDTTNLMTDQAVTEVMTAVLRAIQIHGRKGDILLLLDIGVKIYEMFRRTFPVVKQVLANLDSINEVELEAFDKAFLVSNRTPKQCKLTKHLFKNLVRNVAGRHISEMMKKDVTIRDLEPMFKHTRPKHVRLDDVSPNLHLCSLFGGTPL